MWDYANVKPKIFFFKESIFKNKFETRRCLYKYFFFNKDNLFNENVFVFCPCYEFINHVEKYFLVKNNF